jgi:hypothetical protein
LKRSDRSEIKEGNMRLKIKERSDDGNGGRTYGNIK